jgi:uncharacterized integral membrane protein
MPEEIISGPLTRKDRISVVLYRTGIGISGLLMLFLGMVMYFNGIVKVSGEVRVASPFGGVSNSSGTLASLSIGYGGIILILLYLSAGLSVINIHLYIGRLKRFLKGLYFFSLFMLLILFLIGRGNPLYPLFEMPFTAFLLLPLGGVLAFIGAKEAYCFGLLEGYLFAIVFILYICLWPMLGNELKIYGLFISSLLCLFLALRKAVMPLSFDIGDKSKYIP